MNILALITFFALFLGFIFTLLGTVEKDLISVFLSLVSQDNDALLVGTPEFLYTCINGNGDLKKSLNLNIDSMDYIESLKNANEKLRILKDNTTELLNKKIAYNTYKTDFDKRINFEIEDGFYLKTKYGTPKSLELKTYLNGLNNDVSSAKDEWKISCQTNRYSCDERSNVDLIHTENYCIELSSCKNKDLDNWYSSNRDNKK